MVMTTCDSTVIILLLLHTKWYFSGILVIHLMAVISPAKVCHFLLCCVII